MNGNLTRNLAKLSIKPDFRLPIKEPAISSPEKFKGVTTTCLIWLGVIGAAFAASLLQGSDVNLLAPYAATAAAPALLTFILKPLLRYEWARLMVIFFWLALAVVACLSIAVWPYAILFLCAPVIAALFEREMITETLILSSIIAALVFYAEKTGHLTPVIPLGEGTQWSSLVTPIGIIALTLSALYATSQSRLREAAFQTLPAAAAGEIAHILDDLPGGVIRITHDRKISFASTAAYEIFGLPKDAGHLPVQAISPKDAVFRDNFKTLLNRAASAGKPVKDTLTAERAGLRSTYVITVTPQDNGFLVHGSETTKHENEMEALRLEQANLKRSINDKNLFFSGVSHELRTPLNAIIGFSDMMRSRLFGPLPNKYAEYADLIHDSGQHMLDLIGDVLDLSKVDAGKYTLTYHAFDMADVIRSTVKMVQPSADAAHIKLSIHVVSDQDLIIEADRKAVRQILLNLISNSIKFTPKGGEIVISTKALADTLHLSVSDNGMGMSPEELETIGTPYTQAKNASQIDARGSGLGLSLVKSLVDLHKGRFAIASQENNGTVVEIYLPRSASQETES